MTERDDLARRFELHRAHLRAIAYRMLGSLSEAEDAVQESWLRLARADVSGVANLAAWLRTVVSRVCLDMLRARAARREELAGQQLPGQQLPGGTPGDSRAGDPEAEVLLADSVGRALLVVLDRLAPPERLAFVLHDMFAVPFVEIAPIVGRSPATTKKLASRARYRVRGAPAIRTPELAARRQVVEAFLAASRAGDVGAVLAVLAPDVVRRADAAELPAGRAAEARGARTVAQEIAVFGRNARFAALALVDGDVGILVAPRGYLLLAITFAIEDSKVAAYELIAEPTRLRHLTLATLDPAGSAEQGRSAGVAQEQVAVGG
ncbi:MAG TPA: sigma-70 family RNA polymerase sigma factor [Streptosporangiaceae bacterium]